MDLTLSLLSVIMRRPSRHGRRTDLTASSLRKLPFGRLRCRNLSKTRDRSTLLIRLRSLTVLATPRTLIDIVLFGRSSMKVRRTLLMDLLRHTVIYRDRKAFGRALRNIRIRRSFSEFRLLARTSSGPRTTCSRTYALVNWRRRAPLLTQLAW